MRRMQCGFELNNLAYQCNTVHQGSDWAAAASTSAARTGSGTYGLRCSFSAASGADHTAYCEWLFTANCLYKNTLDSSASSNSVLNPAASPSAFTMRWYYRTDMSNSLANDHDIVRWADAVGTNVIRVNMSRTSAGGNKIIAKVIGSGGTGSGTIDVGSSVWFRYELSAWVDGAGNGAATLTIFAENTEVAQETLTCGISVGSTQAVQRLRLGILSQASNNGAQNHDFDDVAVNDNYLPASSTNIHGGRVGAGACLAAHRTINDDASVAWTTQGSANHYANLDDVDGSGTPGTVDDTDYNYTQLGASTEVDRYGHTAYAGGDTIKSLAIWTRHSNKTNNGTNDFFHRAGMYDGTNYLEAQMIAVGPTLTWEVFIVSEKYGGGALDNDWYLAAPGGNAQIMIRKQANLSNLNDKQVTYIAVECEDDDGLTVTQYAQVSTLNVNQSVPRASIW